MRLTEAGRNSKAYCAAWATEHSAQVKLPWERRPAANAAAQDIRRITSFALMRPTAPYAERPEQGTRCVAAGCLRKPKARRMCNMHYKRWHRGQRVDGYVAPIEAAPVVPRSPVDRAHANALEVARKRELHAARLAGCPLERALAAGWFHKFGNGNWPSGEPNALQPFAEQKNMPIRRSA